MPAQLSGSMATPTDELSLLLSKLCVIQAAESSLSSANSAASYQRVLAKRRRNEGVPLFRCPTEIISDILLLVREIWVDDLSKSHPRSRIDMLLDLEGLEPRKPSDAEMYELRVARLGWINALHVCHDIREIGLATQALWTTIDITSEQSAPMDRIGAFLQRSGTSLVDVAVTLGIFSHDLPIFRIFKLCVSPLHASRVRSLSLRDREFDGALWMMLTLLKSLPCMETLELTWDGDGLLPTSFNFDAPRLSSLTITGLLPLSTQNIFANLTTFEFYAGQKQYRRAREHLAAILSQTVRLERLLLHEECCRESVFSHFLGIVIPPTVTRCDLYLGCGASDYEDVFRETYASSRGTTIHLYNGPNVPQTVMIMGS